MIARTQGRQSAAPVGSIVQQNIHTLIEAKREHEQAKGPQERAADLLTRFSGSMVFVYTHAAWFAIWMVLNLGVGGVPSFDPFPFGLLTMIVSLEAIFLSTFVLLSQNRGAELAEKRAELDLQTNLLAEHELTRVLRIARAIAEKLEVSLEEADHLAELEADVAPEQIVEAIEQEEAAG